MTDPSQQRCSARSKRTGEQCGNWPVRGATVCRMHGGRTPQARRAAARRLAVEQARAEVRRLGLPLNVDPLDVLLDQVREAAGNVSAYRLAVAGFGVHVGREDGVQGVARAAIEGEHYAIPEEVHILVRMYDSERDRLTRYAKMCLDAGVDERRVRVAEGDAQRLAAALGRALDRLTLTEDQRAELRTALADELRALGAAERHP